MTGTAVPAGLEAQFGAHRSFLWALCYRLTGNAADADDLVQETFLRAAQRPPARTDVPWRPWLVRVALNLGRDLLRRRRRRREGTWLPAPIETGDEPRHPAIGRDEPPSFEPTAGAQGCPAARYDLLESVSFAFLLALEALTPRQRAVLLLRDVFDYSVRETAEALAMSEANVKTTLLRARRVMEAYERARRPVTPEMQKRTGQTVERFLTLLSGGDAAGLESLLAEGVRSVSDGGEFPAARLPIVGRDKVIRLYATLAERLGPGVRVQVRTLNGLPAAVIDVEGAPPGWAPRTVLLFRVDDRGIVEEMYAVLASRKLTALRP